MKRLHSAAAALALLLLSLAASSCETTQLAPKERWSMMGSPAPAAAFDDPMDVVPPAGEGAYFGVFAPDAPFDMAALDTFQRQAGKKPAMLMWFQPWGSQGRYRFATEQMEELKERNIVPVISWEPWNPPQDPRSVSRPEVSPSYQLTDITRGDYDSHIRTWAKDVKEYGGPIMLRIMHEMNGNWYPWAGTVNGNQPKDFVPAWRHIHQIFREEGATNVTWVWSVNANSVPNTAENSFDKYYPGDQYVDWIAISGYNYGTSLPSSKFRTFKELYDLPMRELTKYKKPILPSELGSVEQGGDKAAWTRQTFQQMPSFTQMRGFIWFNALDEDRDVRINSSPESLAAFKDAISNSYYLSGVTLRGEGPVMESKTSGLPSNMDK